MRRCQWWSIRDGAHRILRPIHWFRHSRVFSLDDHPSKSAFFVQVGAVISTMECNKEDGGGPEGTVLVFICTLLRTRSVPCLISNLRLGSVMRQLWREHELEASILSR